MECLIADAFGNIYVVVAVLAIACIALAFRNLATRTRKGTVLLLGFALCVVAKQLGGLTDDRLLRGLAGIAGVGGMAGILIGIYDLIRKRQPREIKESPPE
jgi:hypothetical protein